MININICICNPEIFHTQAHSGETEIETEKECMDKCRYQDKQRK